VASIGNFLLKTHSKWQFCMVIALGLLLLNGCGGGAGSTTSGGTANPTPTPTPTATPAATLVSIAVSPQGSAVAAGLIQQLSAKGTFSDGTSQSLATAIWASSDTTLATVNASGLVTTLKQGVVTISASVGTIKGSSPLTVNAPVPVSLKITPLTPVVTLGVSTSTQLSAGIVLTDASTVDVTSTAAWSSSNPSVAAIDSSGLVTPARLGYTRISATSGVLSSSVDLPIVSVPRYMYFSSSAGRTISKGTVDPNDGHITMAGYIPGATLNSDSSCYTTDPLDQFVYSGDLIFNGTAFAGQVDMYKLDPATGALNLIPGANPLPLPNEGNCIYFESTGKFGYSNIGSDADPRLATFSRDTTTGLLTLQSSVDLGLIVTRPAIDPLGKYLYLAGLDPTFTTAQALGFSIDSVTGNLTPIPGTPFALTNLVGDFSFDPSGQFVYMSNAGGTSIDSYTIDRTTGKLTASGSITTCVNPSVLRFNLTAKFAYTTCSMDFAHDPLSASVESFSLAADGKLTHIGSAPAHDSPSSLTLDSSGQFFYLTSNGSYIEQYKIAASGVAQFTRKIGTASNESNVLVMGGPSAVKYTPTFAYVTSTGDNKLTSYAVNADGTFSAPASSVVTQLSPFSLGLLPGTELLLASSVALPNLTAFDLSPAPASPAGLPSFGAAAQAGGVAIDPSGQWAFASDAANNTVTTYAKSFTNDFFLLTYLPSGQPPFSTFATGVTPGQIAVDPLGRLVFVLNQGDNSISVFQYFGTSPELIEAKGIFVSPFTDGSPFAIGSKPLAMAIDPAERFLYVICSDQTLRVFSIDYFSGGHIVQVSSTALGGQPVGVAAEASGRFVYTADSSGVTAFSVNAQTGAMTKVTLPAAIAPTNINGVYVDASDKFLYVTTSTNGVGGTVLGFGINADGSLTGMTGNPLATPNQPSSMVFGTDIR
jgi:6-phosphogluconolactonase (cycloisomerase 2 family)